MKMLQLKKLSSKDIICLLYNTKVRMKIINLLSDSLCLLILMFCDYDTSNTHYSKNSHLNYLKIGISITLMKRNIHNSPQNYVILF